MLKIKFWRIENVLFMKILEQGEEIKRGDFIFATDNGIIIESTEYPRMGPKIYPNLNSGQQDLSPKNLCVMGTLISSDDKIVMHRFNTVEEAKGFLKLYNDAIKEYNNFLSSSTKKIEIEEDVEIVISE